MGQPSNKVKTDDFSHKSSFDCVSDGFILIIPSRLYSSRDTLGVNDCRMVCGTFSIATFPSQYFYHHQKLYDTHHRHKNIINQLFTGFTCTDIVVFSHRKVRTISSSSCPSQWWLLVLGCCGLVQQQHEFRHDCSTCFSGKFKLLNQHQLVAAQLTQEIRG